jgi:hypothetical protein
MTALGLTLMGLAPGVVWAVVYWCGRAIDRARRDREAEASALAKQGVNVGLSRTLCEGLERVRVALNGTPLTGPPQEPEPHIEVLKLRAHKLYLRLPIGPDAIVKQAIRSGDREALLAVLREENA